MKQTISLRAAARPAWQADPKPRSGSETTLAPRRAATRADASVEPLSTTSAPKPGGIAPNTLGRASASFSTGRITSITARTLGDAVGRGHYEAVTAARGLSLIVMWNARPSARRPS